MPRAFPGTSGPGLPRSLKNLAGSLKGGLVGDSLQHESGASATELDMSTFESVILTGDSAGVEVVQLGEGDHIGQRKLITFGTQTDASDSVSVTGGPNGALQTAAAAVNPMIVTVKIPATQFAAGTSVWASCPVAGNITRVVSVTDAVVDVNTELAVELGGTLVVNSEVAIASAGSAVGIVDTTGAITNGATTLVTKGQQMEITGDGAGTTGEATVFIEVTPHGVGAPVQVTKNLPATQYAAGTSVFAVAPVNGRIRRVRTVATETTTLVGTVGLELGGIVVQGSSVTIATGASVGDLDDSGQIYDLDYTNYVEAGDPIEITCDSTPSAGAVDVVIEIDANMGRGPVIVDTLIPATQFAAGTSVFVVAPVTGFVNRVRSVVDVLTAAAEEIALELATVLVVGSETTIADASAIGTVDETDAGAIGEVATAAVTLEDPVEITNDGGATAGEATVWVEFNPTANIASVALADPDDFVLFECKGKGLWEIVQYNGIVA